MSDVSDDEPFEDSGSEYLPSGPDTDSESDDSLSSISEDEDHVATIMGNFSVVADPFSDERATTTVPFSGDYEGFHPAIDLDLENMKDPVNCLEAFLSRNIIHHICNWTNERAGRYLIEIGTQKVYGIIWKDVTVPEMYTFSLNLYMGLVRYPSIRDYLNKTFLFSGPNIFDSQIMSRNRFFAILKFLRFSNPQAFIPGKPITRLAMFFAWVKENCMNLVDPGGTVAIDECLVLYKGRLHFKQFIKSKRARFGIKMFCLCPSHPDLRGYTYNFAMYFGKDIYNVEDVHGTEHLSLSERIVVYLFKQLLDQGGEIIIDNWYMSLRLAEFLLTKKTYVTGTIRVNRGVPKELTEISLNKFQTCFVRKSDVLIIRYRDKRDVYLLSTKLTAGFVENNRYQASVSTHLLLQKPSAIEHYNTNMGAVDAVDQDIEPYNCARKNYSWFKKIGLHVVQRMVLNAKVLYIHANGKDISVLEFHKCLIDGLLAKYSPAYTTMKQKFQGKKQKKRNKDIFLLLPQKNMDLAANEELAEFVTNNRRKELTQLICAVFALTHQFIYVQRHILMNTMATI